MSILVLIGPTLYAALVSARLGIAIFVSSPLYLSSIEIGTSILECSTLPVGQVTKAG